MATKKQTDHTQRRLIVVIIAVLVVAAILVVMTMQLRINSMQATIDQMSVYSFAHESNDANRQKLTINPESYQAFIPTARLQMPYSPVISQVLFNDASNHDLDKQGSVQLTTVSEAYAFDTSIAYTSGTPVRGCFAAYTISINEKNDDEASKTVFTKTLYDGRKVTVSQSTDEGCQQFIEGDSGQAIISALRSIQSY